MSVKFGVSDSFDKKLSQIGQKTSCTNGQKGCNVQTMDQLKFIFSPKDVLYDLTDSVPGDLKPLVTSQSPQKASIQIILRWRLQKRK